MHLYFVFVYCLYLLKFVSNKYLTGFKTKPNLCQATGLFLIEAQFEAKMFHLFGVNVYTQLLIFATNYGLWTHDGEIPNYLCPKSKS